MARRRAGTVPRARSVRRWLFGAVLVAACVEGPTDPGQFGELRIRPSYSEGDQPAALGLGVDSAYVRATRQGETTPVVDTIVAYRSDTASFGWVLTLRDAEEPIQVEVAIWDGGTRVYSGAATVVVREADIAAAGAEPVLVAYVGPPIVATVDIGAESLTLDALDASATLTAEARDRRNVIVPATFTWSSGDPGVATVDATTGTVTAVGNGTTKVRAVAGSASDSATITVAQRVATITVDPDRPTVTALGAQLEMSALVRDPNGRTVSGATVAWSSSDAAVVRIDPSTGAATAVAGGSATITATLGEVAGSTVVTVNPVANVASVVVSPAGETLARVGATRQFTAVARDADGEVLGGVQFAWTSASADVATIDAATGLAQAVAHGTTTVSATAGKASGTATLIVNLTTTVASIAVSPSSMALATIGSTQQFSAQAFDANDAVVPGIPFTWTSGAAQVATVDEASGLATATGQGTTTIAATAGDVTGTATLTVNLTALIASIDVSPASTTLTEDGVTQQFSAIARDASGNMLPGVAFAWTSSMPAVATVDPGSGLATAVAHGSTTITATAGDAAGTAQLSVDLSSTVESLVVLPATETLTAPGATRQFTIEARDESGDIVPGVTALWTSSEPGVATIGATTGLAIAVGHGTSSITARVDDVTATAVLTVDLTTAPMIITVTPAAATLGTIGATQQFTAEARDGNGTVLPNVPFTWSTSAPNIATVDPATGLATAVANGAATITASVNGQGGVATLTVDLMPTVVRIAVTPASVALGGLGATQQFTAEAFDANDAVVPGITFTWTSSAADVATIGESSGLATATGQGTSTIAATAGDVSGAGTLSVDLTTAIASVEVSPVSVTLTALGATRQLTAVARDAANNVLPGVAFTWSSSLDGVATVSDAGLATAVANGTTTMSATAGGVTGTASLTVEQRVARVDVTPASVTVSVGHAVQLAAIAYDANDNIVSGLTFVWSSSAPDLARVDGTGLVTGVAAGTATITAATGPVSGTAAVIVP